MIIGILMALETCLILGQVSHNLLCWSSWRRMLVRNWKHQLLLLCLAKLWIRIVVVVHPTKIKTKLACILEASESFRLRMGESLPNHHQDHIAGKKDIIHYCITFWFTNLFLCLKLWKFQQQRRQWTRNVRRGTKQKWETNLTWLMKQEKKVDRKVHFASLMDLCHLKNAELETKHQKYKCRVVFRGDIVKDDSWSYAVFTEQGSPAS